MTSEARYPTSPSAQLGRHKSHYLIGIGMLAGFQITMNRIDWRAKAAIDVVFGPHPEDAWKPALTILILALVAFGMRMGSRWFVFNAGRDVEYELRYELLRKLHQLGAAFYRKMPAGEIMSRSTNDLQQIRLLYGFGILMLVNVLLALVSGLQVMLAVSVKLSLACLVILPIAVMVSGRLGRGFYTRIRDNQITLGRMNDVLQVNLTGVRVVRSFALEERELERFEERNRAYLEASLALARLRGSFAPAMGAVAALGMLLFFGYGSSLILRGPHAGGISQGEFFAFWAAFIRMTLPILTMGFALNILQRGMVGFGRLREIFAAPPEVVDGPEPSPAALGGELRVDGLGFAYGESKVLDDVSFRVAPGESLAIVGPTGSGKSTLAMLLPRLLPTPRGSIFIDGIDVCDLPLSAVRGAIGYAQQDAFLFSTTVSRNIGFVLDDPDSPAARERVREGAREAQVLDEALGLPQGFDTVVGERGVQLSGGQRQRVSLARALLSESKVLILDDPLSAVDAKTEAAILDAIQRQAAQRTVLVVTHRVAVAARCSRIIVLDEGRIVERGSHDELVAAGGIYAAFVEEQKMARELEELEIA